MIRTKSAEENGLPLAAIQIDGGTQSRASLYQNVVDDYAEAIKAGATFPPIVVFYDGKKHWLADGFHRFHAYQKAGKAKVAADIRQGTRRDAILFSVGANETHGLRRTRDDKRRAVLTLLNDAEWAKWSDREIGRQCAVSHEFVRKMRPVTVNVDSEDRTYTTKHGTTATMKTAGINASRNQFQAKASEDNGSITGGAGAVTGEASRLASGRTDAGEAASVDLPTNSDAVGDTDAIRAGHITRYHVLQLRSAWTKANAEARSIFLVEFNLRQESNPATATGGDDVGRSAERASSAVEVGAPVSPEGATQSVPASPRPCSSLAAREADESAATHSNPQPTSSPDVDKAGDPQDRNEPVSGSPATQFNNPRCLNNCHYAHSRDACHECLVAWSKRPKDEQIRLWAEANEAARAGA